MPTKPTSEVLLLLLLVVPFAFLAVIWPQLPAQIPSHYGMDGQPNQYQSKELVAGLLGGLTLVLYGVFRLLPRFDPRGNLGTGLYQKIRWLILVFWAVFVVWFWYISWRGIGQQTMLSSLMVGIGLLLAGLGNLMNTIKPNYYVGIRTPWTLENTTVWRRTHHLGARLFVAGGLLLAMLALVASATAKMVLLGGLPLLIALITVVYSYIYFQQEKARN